MFLNIPIQEIFKHLKIKKKRVIVNNERKEEERKKE